MWLRQVHGTRVIDAADSTAPVEADAAYARQAGVVCAVLTADCLPVLLCDRAGTRVAAAHAGWRGLAAGVIEEAVARLQPGRGELLAWLGPAIGAGDYVVGDEVRQAFVEHQGLQCGYCTPGMVLSVKQLLDANPDPSEAEIRRGISGNLCRCTGYQYIVKSVQAAAATLGSD